MIKSGVLSNALQFTPEQFLVLLSPHCAAKNLITDFEIFSH